MRLKGRIKLLLLCAPIFVHSILRGNCLTKKPVLVQLGIGYIEVVLPPGAIRRFLPVGSNGLAVLAHGTLIALPEAGRFPPHLPHPLREAHLIDPRNASRVIVEHGVVGGRVIPANEPEGLGWTWWFVAHAHRQKSSVLHPLEGDRSSFYCVGWARQKRRVRDLHLPIAHQSLKGFECRVWLRRRRLRLSMGGVICHHAFSFIFSRSSVRRSWESLSPSSMPLWSIPSRSATDWKTD